MVDTILGMIILHYENPNQLMVIYGFFSPPIFFRELVLHHGHHGLAMANGRHSIVLKGPHRDNKNKALWKTTRKKLGANAKNMAG